MVFLAGFPPQKRKRFWGSWNTRSRSRLGNFSFLPAAVRPLSSWILSAVRGSKHHDHSGQVRIPRRLFLPGFPKMSFLRNATFPWRGFSSVGD